MRVGVGGIALCVALGLGACVPVSIPADGYQGTSGVEARPDEEYERITADAQIEAQFQSAEDTDLWSTVNVSDVPVRVVVETAGPSGGDCVVDTLLSAYADFALTDLVSRDDDGAGVGVCSKLVLPLSPGDALFFEVRALSPVEDASPAPYLLRFLFLAE